MTPILLMEDGGMRYSDVLDGFDAWVQLGDRGWTTDGSNWGQRALESFYEKMREKYPNSIAVRAAWPGFHNRKASWRVNRYMYPRCGKTLEELLLAFRCYYTNSDPLPFLLIITWNDYEEGTAIERGVNNCCDSGTSRANGSAGSNSK